MNSLTTPLIVSLLLSSFLQLALADDATQPSVIPILTNEEAWLRLPSAEIGQDAPLPNWARALADSLPRTTAAMLELDWQHRAATPLDPVLCGNIRLTVAKANRCAYTQAQAEADIARAASNKQELEELLNVRPISEEARAAALEFAHQLTVAADQITDEEVKQLIDYFGERDVVAIVLLVAYSNFQDRLILALQLETEPNGPLPPVQVQFVTGPEARNVIAPQRDAPANALAPPAPELVDDPQWQALDFDALQQHMQQQRRRAGRIRVPTWEEITAKVPANQRPRAPLRIRWSLVCRGYQPQLAGGWSACMSTFAQESKQDRVFEESVFWIITRTIHCFY